MCGKVNVSKLCMDKLCLMYVCMHACMYVCMDGWMDAWVDGWMYICMYLCMYGRFASTLIFPTSGAAAWA